MTDLSTLPTVTHRQGDTFGFRGLYKESGVATSLSGAAISCQLRAVDSGALVAQLTVTVANQTTSPGVFYLRQDYTANAAWPAPALLRGDIEILRGDVKVSSSTFLVDVVED